MTTPIEKAKRDIKRAHNKKWNALTGGRKLLSAPSSNPKIEKGEKINVLTAPLHLAPARLSGHNVCAQSTAGCRAACLHTAGNPAYMTGKNSARIEKTQLFFSHRELFMTQLAYEIRAHERRAAALKMVPAIRLNATSDIIWERRKVTFEGVRYPNLIQLCYHVQFYDYTKIEKRFARLLPHNYHLTFSRSGQNDAACESVLANGGTVAAVFAVTPKGKLPDDFIIGSTKAHVIDGDETDVRFADDPGVIVGLRAKGDARGDTSGFVVYLNEGAVK